MDTQTRRDLLSLLAASALVLLLGPPAHGQTNETQYEGHRVRANEVIVRFKASPTSDKLVNVTAQTDAKRLRKLTKLDHWHVESNTQDVPTLLSQLASDPDVDYVEPNYIVTPDLVPNDTAFANQWGLRNTGQVVNGGYAGVPDADIGTVSAWDVSTGSRTTVVGIVDSGIDDTHPDVTANMWSAPTAFTVSLRGVDVTCAAGTHGYDALTNTCLSGDGNGHGTHIAGIIGATGNNASGVSGVNQVASLMALKFIDASGTGTVADAIEAIEFAIQVKSVFASTKGANVRVLNNSWGGCPFSQALYDEIVKANASDMLFVASAGNNGALNDYSPYYPSSYAVPNVVSVAATDNYDLLPGFSNYGATSVNLAAPGVNIYSTLPVQSYGFLNGTSQSTAFVSGAAALVLAKCTTFNTAALRTNLLAGVTVLSGLTGMVSSNGRLNVNASIRSCSTPATTPSGLTAVNGNMVVGLNWTASAGAATYTVKKATKATGTYAVVASGLTSPGYTVTGLTNGTSYYFKVAAANAMGTTSADSAYVIGKPAPPAIPTGLFAASGISQVDLTWTASAGATSYLVKQSSTATGTYTAVASGVTTRSYSVTGLTNGSTYYFKIAAETPYGNSADTASVIGKPVAFPTPTGLAAAGGNTRVGLTWTASATATSYVVKKATSATGTYTVVASGITSPGYVVTGLTNGTSNYFKVAAVYLSGTSADSAYVLGKAVPPPAAPSSFRVTAQVGQIYLTWRAASTAVGYNVYRAPVSTGPFAKLATATTVNYYDMGLTTGTTYCYQVSAYNGVGDEGAKTSAVCGIVR